MSRKTLFIVDEGCVAGFMLYELLERDLGVNVVPFNVLQPELAEEARSSKEPCCIVILEASSDGRTTNLRVLITVWRAVFDAPIIVVTDGTDDPDFGGFKDVVHVDQEEHVGGSYRKLLELIRSHVGRRKRPRKRSTR